MISKTCSDRGVVLACVCSACFAVTVSDRERIYVLYVLHHYKLILAFAPSVLRIQVRLLYLAAHVLSTLGPCGNILVCPHAVDFVSLRTGTHVL